MDSESAIWTMCGTRLNVQIEYKIHDYFKFRKVDSKLTRLNINDCIIDSKSDLGSSISELESLGLETPQLNELNDSYEVENLVENLKQMLYVEYKSMHVFTD